MAVIATAELVVDAPVSTAFARFLDFSTWDLWMPEGFRPVTGPARALREGDRFEVALGPGRGLRTPLRVLRVRPDKEICWRGGVRGVLSGEHSFFFEAADGQRTRVRSEEPFTGLLTVGPLGALLEREGSKTGELTLRSFASHLAKQAAS